MKTCSNCGKKLDNRNITGFCRDCLTQKRQEKKVEDWLSTGNVGMGVDTTIRGAIRDYILKDQENKCAICGILNIWNDKELKFVLDHIDGNAANSCRENLRLVCPNCDSQLDTFKSKNKHSARNARKDWQKDNLKS